MKRQIFLVFILVLAIGSESLKADELSFPETEKDIVAALSLQDGEVVHNGVTYVSKNQKVYKILNGKRVRVRGMILIAKTPLAPKTGALISFDHDSARISDDSFSLLDEFGKALTGALKGAVLTVGGHTDSAGNGDYNLRLSKLRAESVVAYLVSNFEIEQKRLRIEAFGEDVPIASNDSEAGRARNRRVEFTRVE